MKVTIVPIVIGAFGTITKGLLKGLEDLEFGGRSKWQHYWEWPEYWDESWRLEETCCHSNSSEKPSANTDVENSKGVNNNDNSDSMKNPLTRADEKKLTRSIIIIIIIFSKMRVIPHVAGALGNSDVKISSKLLEEYWGPKETCCLADFSVKRVQDKERLGRKGDSLEIVEKIEFWPYYQMVIAQLRICPRKWAAYNSLGLWDTNESPDQKTRRNANKQTKRT